MSRVNIMSGQKPTHLTDSDNPFIIDMAKKVTEKATNEKEAAIAIFYFVRDTVLFGGSDLYGKASHTLKCGIGDCGIKSNVQISMLRALGILGRLKVTMIQSYVLKRILPASVSKNLPKEISHIGCECFISGKWISCETSYDVGLFEVVNRLEQNPKDRIQSIDWDGEHDLVLFHKWITKDIGTFASYDAFIDYAKHGEQKYIMPPKLYWLLFGWYSNRILNRHLDKLRKK